MPVSSMPASTEPGPAEQELSPRRRRLLDAALHVVADQGLRGLTHRAVDREAGLPEGTCSAYLRTRKALQSALTAYVAGTLAADVAGLAREIEGCSSADGGQEAGQEGRAIELTTGLFLRWLDEREVLVAKLELTLEAARDPELAELLASYRAELVVVVDAILAQRGKEHSTERAEAVVAAYDGVLASALLKPRATRQEFVSRSLELIFAALAPE